MNSTCRTNISQIEGVEIEYVSAPLDFELPVAAPGIKAEAGSEDMPVDEPATAGLGSSSLKQEEADAGTAPSTAAEEDPAAELARIMQRFGRVEDMLGTSGAEADEAEERNGGAADGRGDGEAQEQDPGSSDEGKRWRQHAESEEVDSLACGRSWLAPVECAEGSLPLPVNQGPVVLPAPCPAKLSTPLTHSPLPTVNTEGGEAQLSKKKLRAASRLKVAELKQACARPDVVEIWDVTAADPKLLVHLKVSAGCLCGSGTFHDTAHAQVSLHCQARWMPRLGLASWSVLCDSKSTLPLAHAGVQEYRACAKALVAEESVPPGKARY